MYHYIKFSADHTPLGHVSQDVPFEGYNTASDSAENGKPYYAEAALVQPTPGAGEQLTGPVYSLDPATITYSVEAAPKPTVISYNAFRARFTPEELALVKAATLAYADVLDLALVGVANNAVALEGTTAAAFLDAMVAANAITLQRRTEIIIP